MADYPDLLSSGKETIERFSNDARQILTAILTNKEFAWIFEPHGNSYSELPFIYKRDTCFVSGIIDRVVVKEGRGYVVDYKAIAVENDEALQSWMDHYRPQVKIYCEAVKEMFRLDAVEGYLLFVDSGRLALTAKE